MTGFWSFCMTRCWILSAMSPEIQERSHKSRSRINNLYLLTRPTCYAYVSCVLSVPGCWESACYTAAETLCCCWWQRLRRCHSTGRRAQYRTIWIKVEIILTKRTTQNGKSFVRLLGTSLIARPNARTSIHISSRSQLKQDVPGKVGQ